MATRVRIIERTPVEGVELEYALTSRSRRSTKARFNRGRLLSITEDTVELGSREALRAGDTLALTFHTAQVDNFLRVNTKIENCTRVTILKQPAFCVTLTFLNPDGSQRRKIAWAVDQYSQRKPPTIPPRNAPRVPGRAIVPDDAQKAAVKTRAAPTLPGRPASGVRRPVALLDLIRSLDDLQVTQDLILAVLEAAEMGMDVEVLFPVSGDSSYPHMEEEEGVELETEAPPEPSEARPINVYRMATSTALHFSASGMPAGPATGLFYYSGLKSPETCFAVELGMDIMAQNGYPSFDVGTLLVFSSSAAVEDGDFAYLKVRGNDMFAQIFFGKKDAVRIRFLNPKYPEANVKRREVRVMCKLVGAYRSNV